MTLLIYDELLSSQHYFTINIRITLLRYCTECFIILLMHLINAICKHKHTRLDKHVLYVNMV